MRGSKQKPLKIHASSSHLRAKREWHLSPGLCGLVNTQDQLERLSAGPAIGVRLRFTPENSQNVAVVTLMTQTIDVRWIGVSSENQLVVIVVFGELPVLDLVHSRSANLRRALFPQYGNRALEIPRIGKHCHLDRAESSRPEFQDGDSGVFGLDAPCERRGFCHHALNRPH